MALIKQLKDNQTSIYPVTHSQAVICNGTTLDQVIEDLRTGEGGISSETDPIFSASPAATITEQKKSEWDNKMDKVTLSNVATSGSYNDLINKPTIPSAVTESTVSGWGFTKNTGTYSKPSGGIPKTDLASSVQTSLSKADTALQSYTEQYTGTITGVSANGTSVATSGVANIPAASGSTYGVTKLSSATNSTSTTLAATPNAVKSAYDLANGKQDKLVSGTNIKTINGESILGSGDIEISGGGTGGGEDIRYFTEFTVEEFIDGCKNENIISSTVEDLTTAVRNNKIICIPYDDCYKGFLVASYKKHIDTSNNFEMYIEVTGKTYTAFCTENDSEGDPVGLFGSYIEGQPVTNIEYVYSDEYNGYINLLIKNNTIYIISGTLNELTIYSYDELTIGSTIRFTTSEDCTLNFGTDGFCNWPNGIVPDIQPFTSYELSLASSGEFFTLNIILTPFSNVL